MKNLRFLVIVIALNFSLTHCLSQSIDFINFLNNFDQLQFPFIVSDEPLINNKNIFTKGFDKEEYQKILDNIKEPIATNSYFYFGAKYQYKDLKIVIYRISCYGDAPALDTIKVVIVIFNKENKMISKMTIGGMETDNKLMNCIFRQDLTFTISVLNGSNVLQNKKNYYIDENGVIKVLP